MFMVFTVESWGTLWMIGSSSCAKIVAEVSKVIPKAVFLRYIDVNIVIIGSRFKRF